MYTNVVRPHRLPLPLLVLSMVISLLFILYVCTNMAFAQKDGEPSPVSITEVAQQGQDIVMSLHWQEGKVPTNAWLEVSDTQGFIIIVDIIERTDMSGDQRIIVPNALVGNSDSSPLQRNLTLFDGDTGQTLILTGIQVTKETAQLVAPWPWPLNCPIKVFIGTQGNDNDLHGTFAFSNFIFGLGGNDQIWGEGCNDRLYGMVGDDTIFGEAGDDWIVGGLGNDRLWGNPGNNQIWGGIGDDYIQGGVEIDALHGDNGADLIYGNNGDDKLYGGAGDDVIYGTNGVDLANDTDLIYGGGGNDHLYGDDGNDEIHGGLGDDIIDGGPGKDRCYGEDGNDTFANCEVVIQ